MKKTLIAATLIAPVLAFSLTACSKKDEPVSLPAPAIAPSLNTTDAPATQPPALPAATPAPAGDAPATAASDNKPADK